LRIIAIAPGRTTGWAVWEEGLPIDHGSMGPKEHHGELWKLLVGEWQSADTIICQSHTVAAPLTITTEYIGVVKSAADVFNTRLVMQGDHVLNSISNQKLRKWGAKHTSWYLEKEQIAAEGHILFHLLHNVYVPEALRQRTIRSLRPVVEN
jgi:hypothetical protein